MGAAELFLDLYNRINEDTLTADASKVNLLASIEMRSDSSSLSPVIGSVPFSLIYLRMRRRS